MCEKMGDVLRWSCSIALIVLYLMGLFDIIEVKYMVIPMIVLFALASVYGFLFVYKTTEGTTERKLLLATLNCLVTSIVVAVCLFALIYNTSISSMGYWNITLLFLVFGWLIIFKVMKSMRNTRD